MKKNLPVYSIRDFGEFKSDDSFYANRVNKHVAQHHFTHLPHKHNFYLTILFTKGNGNHEIDFETYEVKPGALFILKPGQMHYWKLSADVDGFVFFHSKEFYEEGFTTERLANYQFFKSFQGRVYYLLKGDTLQNIESLMQEVLTEYEEVRKYRFQVIHALLTLCYASISRLDSKANATKKETYLRQAEQFEELLEKKYKTLKSASIYASELNISEKHLNRIIKDCLNKTTAQLIAERVILEAKRMLAQDKFNIEEIGRELGFDDKSYFTRFFRKNVGKTPSAFLENLRGENK